jgi:uroporphyrinogen decarboxylase
MENFMIDLIKRKDFVNDIMDRLMNYHLQVSKKLVAMGIDIIFWGDDIGCEYGPIISPELWKEFLYPRYAYMVQEVRKINKDIKIAFHSDGYIEHAIDDFVEIGFDILNPLQTKVNNIEMIKRKYGKKLTFLGNVDTRYVLSNGSPEDVTNEVKNVIKTLAPGGGLILCTNHRIQATEKSLDNTIIYYWAAEKLRNYPIQF